MHVRRGKMKKLRTSVHTSVTTALLLFFLTGASSAAQLNIPAVYQQTKVWCWAASAEMVFRHYGMRSISSVSYQCGIVNAWVVLAFRTVPTV